MERENRRASPLRIKKEERLLKDFGVVKVPTGWLLVFPCRLICSVGSGRAFSENVGLNQQEHNCSRAQTAESTSWRWQGIMAFAVKKPNLITSA
jgi:hypothetical protein